MAFWHELLRARPAHTGGFKPRVLQLEERTVPTVATPLPPLAGATSDSVAVVSGSTTATTTSTGATSVTTTTGTGTSSTAITPGGASTTTTTTGGSTTVTVTDGQGSSQTATTPQPALIAYGAEAGNAPMVRAYDANGTVRFNFAAYDAQFKGGVRVATGDVTGDGVEDIVTAPGAGTRPIVKVFNGATGELVQSFLAYDQAFRGGVYVAVGDVNGDGRADIITGADQGGGPHVRAFSGKDPTVILSSFYAYNPEFHGGVRVAAGDVNGDGTAEIITGAGISGGPHVEAFDANGNVLVSFYALAPAFTGGVFVSAGDFTGDGKAEIVTGAGNRGATTVGVFSATDGALLRQFRVTSDNITNSVRVGVGDVNADGKADLLATVKGGLYAYSGANLLKKLPGYRPFDPANMDGGMFIG